MRPRENAHARTGTLREHSVRGFGERERAWKTDVLKERAHARTRKREKGRERTQDRNRSRARAVFEWSGICVEQYLDLGPCLSGAVFERCPACSRVVRCGGERVSTHTPDLKAISCPIFE